MSPKTQKRLPAGRHGPRRLPTHMRRPQVPIKKGVLRVIPLGGFEEVGRNMMLLEYENDIIIIDMGLQFPEEETPGIDYIIPNVAYLQDKTHKIRGVLITHGHYDHIGAIPHLIGKLGNPPIYTTPFAAAVIQKRQFDFPHNPKLNIEHVTDKSVIRLGVFTVRYFPVTHNIPEAVGIEIETPVGIIVNPGEFKYDYDRKGNPVGLEPLIALGKKGVRLLMLDSTKSEEPGRSIPEWKVEENIEILLKEAPGRVVISTFASLLDRLIQIVHIADRLGRKVAITGRSMETNFAIARELGLIKIKKETVVAIKDVDRYHDKKVLIITTGAQGEEFAGLTRMAYRTHRDVKIKPGDTVIFSSSIVPGNERSAQVLRDNLSRQGAIVYHYKMLDIHSGGHGTRDEYKETIQLIKPKFFMPIHGYYFMRWVNAKNAQEAGIPAGNIAVGDNGQVVEVTPEKIQLTREFAPTNYVMVDGLGVGDVGTIVLRDRQQLAKDGMFVIISVINAKTGRVIGNPDIISRGFIYLRESKQLLHDARRLVKEIIEQAAAGEHPLNEIHIKEQIRKRLEKFFFQKTERSPMVLPVIIEV